MVNALDFKCLLLASTVLCRLLALNLCGQNNTTYSVVYHSLSLRKTQFTTSSGFYNQRFARSWPRNSTPHPTCLVLESRRVLFEPLFDACVTCIVAVLLTSSSWPCLVISHCIGAFLLHILYGTFPPASVASPVRWFSCSWNPVAYLYAFSSTQVPATRLEVPTNLWTNDHYYCQTRTGMRTLWANSTSLTEAGGFRF